MEDSQEPSGPKRSSYVALFRERIYAQAVARYYIAARTLLARLPPDLVALTGSSAELRDRAMRLQAELKARGRSDAHGLVDAMNALADLRDPELSAWTLIKDDDDGML